MNYFLTSLISATVLIGGIFIGHQQIQQPNVVQFGSSFSPVQGNTYYLAGAGVTNSATTIQLTSFTLPDPGKTPIQMSMFGQIGYAVLEPQTSKIENISFTGVTQNGNGTAILTGVSRGLSFYTPYAASTTLALSHAGGSTIILSNSAAFYGQQFLFANNVGSSTASITYSNTAPPFYWPGPGAQTSGNQISTTSEFASVAYVNATAVAGASNATESVKGIVQFATAAQQASSTALGSTAAGLVTQARYATDTPQAKCNSLGSANGAGCSVIANLAGKLAQAWLDLTAAFSVSGAWIFSNTVSIAASVSFPLTLNTVSYSLPSSASTASTTLTNANGTGALTWAIPNGVLIASTTISSAVATTTLSFPSNIGTDLRAVIEIPALSAASAIQMQLSGDTGANYAYNASQNTADTINISGTNNISLSARDSTANTQFSFFLNITNTPGDVKMMTWSGFSANGSGASTMYLGGGVWNNTSGKITSISIGAGQGGATLRVGTRISVYSVSGTQ